MARPNIPSLKLNRGHKIPILGLGTWAFENSGDREKIEQTVYEAILAGYRHIDTAWIYKVEDQVGRAVRRAISEGIVTRQEIFVTSKVWCTHLKPENVLKSCKESVEALNLEYIDLLLIHFPFPLATDENGMPVINSEGGLEVIELDIHKETWRAMEQCVKNGWTRSIGVSNYNSKLVEDLMSTNPEIKPSVNQVECHPYLNQTKLIETCSKYGIILTAYSPFGGNPVPVNLDIKGKEFEPSKIQTSLFNHPVITSIAKKYNKTPTHVLLKFNTQRGMTVIPKTTRRDRLMDNLNIFDFELTKEELEAILELDGLVKNPVKNFWKSLENHKYYPFHSI